MIIEFHVYVFLSVDEEICSIELGEAEELGDYDTEVVCTTIDPVECPVEIVDDETNGILLQWALMITISLISLSYII